MCKPEEICFSEFALKLDECDIRYSTVVYYLNCIKRLTGDSYTEIINAATRKYYEISSKNLSKLKDDVTPKKCKNEKCYLCRLEANSGSCHMMILEDALEVTMKGLSSIK